MYFNFIYNKYKPQGMNVIYKHIEISNKFFFFISFFLSRLYSHFTSLVFFPSVVASGIISLFFQFLINYSLVPTLLFWLLVNFDTDYRYFGIKEKKINEKFS